ncbi:DICT sensory domain-containing protein [Nocardioides sp. SYSU D00038]|uniref:DICT sensory domain-containing protein n=1 Tax=Nocardioides sp. SYSU D00038 TaxID=2812554 RepID=UPI001968244C|nr:DICT sensory domain-containing protein [Nocardioides sp. SYSU D00038]
MTKDQPQSPPGEGAVLSIGDLAERTGVAAATLRMWEQRHGFPVPHRLPSGHRRYDDGHVRAVRAVVDRRDAGVRLDAAIAQVAAPQPEAPTPPSVWAQLRRTRPDLAAHRLRKRTLVALSRAIEDELCSTAERASVFGGFQRREFYARSRERWQEVDRVAGSAFAFADFPTVADGHGPALVPLPTDAPMLREWVVACDSRRLPAVLVAWEVPGQAGVPDADRVFEAVWTIDPAAARDAARTCAEVAVAAGVARAVPVLAALAGPPPVGSVDPGSVTRLLSRVLAYVDGAAV